MSIRIINAQTQLQRGSAFVVHPESGGTGHTEGSGHGVYQRVHNATNATIDYGTVVRFGDAIYDHVSPTVQPTGSPEEVALGVVTDFYGIADNGFGHAKTEGVCDVLIDGTATRGQWICPSATAGYAQATDEYLPNIFGVVLDDGEDELVPCRIDTSPTGPVAVHRSLGLHAGIVRHMDLTLGRHILQSGTWAFELNDEDATTYYHPTGGGTLQVNLREPFVAGALHMVAGCAGASTVSYEVKATNNSDFSGLTSIAIYDIVFVAGSFAQQDVFFGWESPGTAYQYWQFAPASGTPNLQIWSLELLEATGQVVIAEDPSSASVNDRLDTVLANIYTGGIPKSALEIIIDGGGAAITTGVKADVECPFNGSIVSARLFADVSGAIKIDIWKDTYANFPPTDADSITAGMEPEIAASGVQYEDTTLYDWDVDFAEGDILRFNVDSCASITRVTLSLAVERF